jgi:hypothetical protein
MAPGSKRTVILSVARADGDGIPSLLNGRWSIGHAAGPSAALTSAPLTTLHSRLPTRFAPLGISVGVKP